MKIVRAAWHDIPLVTQQRYNRGWSVTGAALEQVCALVRAQCELHFKPPEGVVPPAAEPSAASEGVVPPAPQPARKRPMYTNKTRGELEYLRMHRAELRTAVLALHPGVAGETLKQLLRSEAAEVFKDLPLDQQWQLATAAPLGRDAVQRGARGRFGAALAPDLTVLPASAPPAARVPAAEVTEPYTKLFRDSRKRRTRTRRLKIYLRKTASGSFQVEPEVEDVVASLLDVMTKEQIIGLARSDKFQKAVAGDRPDHAWAALGKEVVGLLFQHFAACFAIMTLLCIAVRLCGFSREFCSKFLNFKLARRPWKRSKDLTVPPLTEKTGNGRRGWRKLAPEKLRELFVRYSQATSDLLMGRKRKGEEPANAPVVKRALTDTVSGIFATEKDNASSTVNEEEVKLRTLQRNFKEDKIVYDIRHAGRELDKCQKCCAWTKTLCPRVATTIKNIHRSLDLAWPGYWDAWEKEFEPTFSEQERREFSYKFLKAYFAYTCLARHVRSGATTNLLQTFTNALEIPLGA